MTLDELPLEVYKEYSTLFEADGMDFFNFNASTDRRNITGGTGRDALCGQIAQAKEIYGRGESATRPYQQKEGG
jgi:argininosuccinate lyase